MNHLLLCEIKMIAKQSWKKEQFLNYTGPRAKASVSKDNSHLSRAGQHRRGDPFLIGVKLHLRTPGSGSILGSETSHLHSLQTSILWPHAPRGGCQCRRVVRGGWAPGAPPGHLHTANRAQNTPGATFCRQTRWSNLVLAS